ncbi:MAG TPA: porin [Gemmatimonadales bacterium]
MSRMRTLGIALLVATPAIAEAQGTPPTVRVGGVVFAHYAWFPSEEADGANNFDVTRAYINVTGSFGHGVGARVTPDIYRLADGSLSYRLKYAYASYTPGESPITLKLGQIQTPWLDFEETLWDFRMQGTMALDRNGYVTSSDFGLGADGSWADEGISASVGVYNGEGYNRTPGDRRKDVAGRVSVRLARTDDASRTGGLRLSGFGQYGSPTGGGIRSRALGMLSYRSKLFTLAGEYAVTRDRADDPPAPADPDLETARGEVMSAFGVLRVPDSPVMVIARVDVADPDRDASGDRRTRLIGGVGYQLSPNLRLLADIDHVTYEGGAPTPAAEASRTQALFQMGLTF